MSAQNVSPDLIWALTRENNAFLDKRKQSGVVRFSRDPFNLKNISSRKYDGYVNERAFAIQAHKEGKGLIVTQKSPEFAHQPAKALQSKEFKSSAPARQTYKAIVDNTTRAGYRADLRAEAVARASAIRKSQRSVKAKPAPKPRGKKALLKAVAETE